MNDTLSEREIDMFTADVLPERETLALVSLTVAPKITVTPVVGTSIATQVLTNQSSNAAWVTQFVQV
jgi:hypothetical protein